MIQVKAEGVIDMTTRQRNVMVLVATLILLTVSVYLFWPHRAAHTPIAEPTQNSISPLHATVAPPNDPQSLVPSEVLTNIGELELPQDDRVRLVDELLEAGLPIQPVFRSTVKQQIKDKPVEQMVKEIGNRWAIPPCGTAPDATNIAWLLQTFKGNLRVKQLIQEGRKDPERVGSMVSTDMLKRMSEWYDTCQAQQREYYERGSSGALFGHDGTKGGSSAFMKWLEDGYAIPTEVFVLMNIDYSKGLDTLAELVYRIDKCGERKRVGPDGKLHTYEELGRTHFAPGQQFNNDIVYYAAASLLQHNNDEKYASLRAHLEKQLADKPAYVGIVTDSPDALWPEGGIPFTEYAGIDTSSEPRMNLRMPNPDPSIMKPVRSIGSGLYMLYKDTLTDARPTVQQDELSISP